MSLVLGVWATTTIIIWVDVRQELGELLDGHLAQAAALLVIQGARVGEVNSQSVDVPMLHRYANRVAFQIFRDGRLVLRSANAPEVPMVERDQLRAGFETVELNGRAWRVFGTFNPIGNLQVYVGERAKSRSTIIWAALRSTLWPTLLALPLLAVAAWWAAYRGAAPLLQLGRALAERKPQELTPLNLSGPPTEMLPMLDALNGLFVRISGLMESERRFTADAAHELRTPVAAIRAQVQVALGETNDVERLKALLGSLEGCDRAARVVQQLLTLSKLETGGATAVTSLDLSVVVRRVVADLAPQAFGKNQTMAVEAVDPSCIRGDPTLIAVLVGNLVDNAIRYSPPNAHVNVYVIRQLDHIKLTVENGGEGMTEQDIRRLGERFFRVLGSAAGGSGLGWSIVRRIAEVHRAEIHIARSVKLGGLSVQALWQSDNWRVDKGVVSGFGEPSLPGRQWARG